MIKVVSFDIGGTLIKNNNSNESNYDLHALAELTKIPYEKVRNVYKNIFQKTKGTYETLISEFCNQLSIDNNKDINEFFKNKFKSNEVKKISLDDIEVLKKLKSKGYKVILFSNSSCLLDNYLPNDIKEVVDNIFYSYDLGYTKSDSESYKYIEKILGNKSNEFLHIGDTLSSDYLNPIKNGWNALYYGISGNKEVKSITNLNEIFDWLNSINN